MASDLNVVALVGRLTKDCVTRSTNSGTTVISLSVAVNRSQKDASGQWSDKANFFEVTYFVKSAGIAQYLVKGQQVSIKGELVQEVWEKDGQKRYSVKVQANNISLLGSKKDSQEQPQQYQQPSYAQQARGNYQPKQQAIPPEDFDSDIPF